MVYGPQRIPRFFDFFRSCNREIFLKNLPPGKWKLWAGLILFVLGLYRFVVTVPGPFTGIESFSIHPSSVWKQKEEWIRVFEKTSYGALIASEEMTEEYDSRDSRWVSVLIRQAVRRNIVLRNRFEHPFFSSAEEIVRLFPRQGPEYSPRDEEKHLHSILAEENFPNCFRIFFPKEGFRTFYLDRTR